MTESSDEFAMEDSIVKRRSNAVETGSSSTIRKCGSGATFGEFSCWANNPPYDARRTLTGGEKGYEVCDFVRSAERVLITVLLEFPENFFVIFVGFCSDVLSKFFDDAAIVVVEENFYFRGKDISRCIKKLLEI